MTTLTSVFGGQEHLGRRIKGMKDLDEIIRKGIPFKAISYVKNLLHLTDEEMAKTLGTSVRTLSRRKQAAESGMKKRAKKEDMERLTTVESDRLYRLAKIAALAEDVFEDRGQAVQWLHSPQVGLGGRKPLEMLQTEIGSREVEDLLIRIEHGVYS